jgi:DNA-binding GntR family transcriptional regulator
MTERSAPLDGEPGAEVIHIVNQMKQQIVLGRLKPRERLTEDDLCLQFGASRHLVRSAFTRLEHLGLVIRRPNKGVIVRDFAPEELEEIYSVRALLQGEAARRMPLPAPAELLDRLQQIHAEHANAIAREDLDLVCAHVDDFHHTFFAAVGNRYLAQMIEQLWTETLGVRSYAIGDPLLRARSYEEHGLILDALAAGDRARLEWLVVDHIWSAFNAYKRANGAWRPSPVARTTD